MALPLILASAGLAGGAALAEGLINRTQVSDVDRKRLAELERLKALGELGYSDEELAAIRDVRLSPIQAAGREAQLRALGATQVGDIGSGAAARTLLASQVQVDQARQQAMRDVQAADVAEQARQKEEMKSLEKSIEEQEQARKKETWQAILGAGEAALQTGFSAAAGGPPALPKGEGATGAQTLDQDALQALQAALSLYAAG